MHTTADAEECDIENKTLYMYKSVTDCIECRYMEELHLEALIGDPVARHVYKCVMAEAGELGALLADPRTYNDPMKMPDAKQWEEALRVEMQQLSQHGVFSEPCELPYGANKLKIRATFKKPGAVECWKARLVTQLSLQTFGVDFLDTYAPVA